MSVKFSAAEIRESPFPAERRAMKRNVARQRGWFVLSPRAKARAAGIAQSMGSRGDCWDNAVAESFFATLKKELIHRRTWPSKAELRTEVFDYIEVFYNRQRRHKTLGQRSPADFENSTLMTDRASLAASRLASPTKIKFTTPTTSALA